jgi:hypothetical protein
MGVILLTDGLTPEPDFEDQDDFWRGQKARERRLMKEGLPQVPWF